MVKEIPEQVQVKEIFEKLQNRGYDVEEATRMKLKVTEQPLPLVQLKCEKEEEEA